MISWGSQRAGGCEPTDSGLAGKRKPLGGGGLRPTAVRARHFPPAVAGPTDGGWVPTDGGREPTNPLIITTIVIDSNTNSNVIGMKTITLLVILEKNRVAPCPSFQLK